MQNWILGIFFMIIFINPKQVKAQYSQETTYNKCFIGSTFFMLGNLLPEEKPNFIQLNFGYRITNKDVVSLEIKTWRYHQPLGIQYGKLYNLPENKFPGFVSETGFAVAYQRFLWKGLYTGVHVMNAWQNFINSDDEKIDHGFQVFNTYRLGYHFKLFKNRWFIEPSLAITHRPFHTEMPESFKVLDDQWGKFFFAEPGLHFGFNF
jgi:hypothetical protein